MTLLSIKSLHIVLAILWGAGVLALLTAPQVPGKTSEQLLRWTARVTTPAMLGALASGLWLTVASGWFLSGMFWIFAKILIVLAVLATHGFQHGALLRASLSKTDPRSSIVRNLGIGAVAFASIVVLATMKPF